MRPFAVVSLSELKSKLTVLVVLMSANSFSLYPLDNGTNIDPEQKTFCGLQFSFAVCILTRNVSLHYLIKIGLNAQPVLNYTECPCSTSPQLSEIVAHLVSASSSGLCRTERPRFEPKPEHKLLSVYFT